jgi:hypothetical protein
MGAGTITLTRYVFWRDDCPPAAVFSYSTAERETDARTVPIIRNEYALAVEDLRRAAQLNARTRRSRKARAAAVGLRHQLAQTEAVAYSTKRRTLWKLSTRVRLGERRHEALYDTVTVKGG